MTRKQFLFVGQERAGKTYLAKHYAKKYHQSKTGGIIVYNFGDSDFPKAQYNEITPLTFEEHIVHFYQSKEKKQLYKLNKKVDFFWYKGKVYHFKHFNTIFNNKKVRIAKIYNRPLERAFANALFKYVSNFLLILDDTKMVFTNGLPSEFQQIFGRKNHTGAMANKKNALGLDIICIFHSLGTVNPEIWDYTNTLILLKTVVFPSFKKLNDKQLIALIKEMWEYLNKSKKYTAVKIELKGENRLIAKRIKI